MPPVKNYEKLIGDKLQECYDFIMPLVREMEPPPEPPPPPVGKFEGFRYGISDNGINDGTPWIMPGEKYNRQINFMAANGFVCPWDHDHGRREIRYVQTIDPNFWNEDVDISVILKNGDRLEAEVKGTTSSPSAGWNWPEPYKQASTAGHCHYRWITTMGGYETGKGPAACYVSGTGYTGKEAIVIDGNKKHWKAHWHGHDGNRSAFVFFKGDYKHYTELVGPLYFFMLKGGVWKYTIISDPNKHTIAGSDLKGELPK